jgi:hypothetical protein
MNQLLVKLVKARKKPWNFVRLRGVRGGRFDGLGYTEVVACIDMQLDNYPLVN